MAQWYIKQLSKLTDVSVQALHHYDRIGLLTPSVRLANGYRLYSEKDLLRLQQILALKFFGFELLQIKKLLSTEIDMLDHFIVQSQLLEEKAKSFLNASATLKNIISTSSRGKSIPWETIIKLIEVYHMTQQLEKTWAGKVLTQEELKQYACFEQDLKKRFTLEEQKACEKSWDDLVKDINANLHEDPKTTIGISLGKRCMDWVNSLYGKEFIELRTAIWEKGFKGGYAAAEHKLTNEAVAWLDKAMDAYYKDYIYNILKQVGSQPNNIILKQWDDVLVEMYGSQLAPKLELFNAAMQDTQIRVEAKQWLKQYTNEFKHINGLNT